MYQYPYMVNLKNQRAIIKDKLMDIESKIKIKLIIIKVLKY
jgi:hypothetical protein